MSIPEFALSVVDGSNSPESSAAVAVTTFIVEPGGNGHWVGRLSSGRRSVGELLERVGLAVFGS